MECQHPADERHFNDDCLLEWCGMCGQVVADHHERKYGEPHPFQRRRRPGQHQHAEEGRQP